MEREKDEGCSQGRERSKLDLIAFERTEVALIAAKLRLLAEDAGLSDAEVEMLVGIRTGGWPLSPEASRNWQPSVVQERRLRTLVEVCASSISLFGPQVRLWLRQDLAILGASPTSFLLSHPKALPALRDALREALGLAH